MFTLKPLVARTLRKYGCEAHHRFAAARRWEVEPASETRRIDTFYNEADLAKVTGVAAHTTMASQLDRIRPGTTRHPARHASLVRNVVMVDGHLFTWRMVQPLADRPMPKVALRDAATIASGVLGSTQNGNRFFGHWLLDDMPLALSARALGAAYGHIGADNKVTAHQAAYQAIFEPAVTLIENAFFRELVIFDWADDSSFQQARYAALRAALAAGHPRREHPGVMLLRGRTGQRRVLVNEDDIARLAASRGLRVIDPMAHTVPEIVAACLDARIVMGVEGSHLAHGFLPLAASGAFLTIQPPFKFDHFWKERCDCIGARYAFLVGDSAGDTDFSVDPGAVERLLDRLERAFPATPSS